MYRAFCAITSLAVAAWVSLAVVPSPSVALPASEEADALPGEGPQQAAPATAGTNRPGLDPFRALVQEPVVAPSPVPYFPKPPEVPAPIPPPPPVNFTVSALAGEPHNYQAVLEFEGQTYIVEPGTKVPSEDHPAFEVKAVDAEKVEVFDRKTNRIVRKQLEVN
jgi:hypothetical protein